MKTVFLLLLLALVSGCINNVPDNITNFEECAAAGYPVMESYPRQCRVGDQLFIERIAINSDLCNSSGGHWNECSSRCMLDNQGSDVLCAQVCEALCECAGIAGFSCPLGYECIINSNVTDALGYCMPEKAMTIQEAMEIATSECVNITNSYAYNEYTNTWWIDLDIERDGCSPACVINSVTKESEINWRCTGLLN